MNIFQYFLYLLFTLFLIGCGPKTADFRRQNHIDITHLPEKNSQGLQAHQENIEETLAPPTILFLGDSLLAGVGVEENENFLNLIHKKLDDEMIIIHKIISLEGPGAISAEALMALEKAVHPQANGDGNSINSNPLQVTHLFVCIGANDVFLGKLDETKENLSRIIRLAKANNIQIALIPVGFPYENESELSFLQSAVTKAIGFLSAKLRDRKSNEFDYLGEVKKLNAIYEEIATQEMVHLLLPLLKPLPLGTIGFDTDYVCKTDLLHPNALGHQLIAEALYPQIKKFIGYRP